MSVGILSTLISLAVASGINLYATILMIGVSIRLGWVREVPAGLEVFASWPVLVVAGVFYTMEFLADKIQFIDNLWDALHTFIRPLGAAFLGAEMLSTSQPEVRTAAALIAGTLALTSHSGKAGSRVALNVASPAENVSNIGVSLLEDLTVGALVLFALNYPLVAGSIAIVLLALILIVAPRLIRWAWFLLRALAARFTGLLDKRSSSDPLPPQHAERLPAGTVALSARCTAQGPRRVNGRSGYLSLVGDDLVFTAEGWLRRPTWRIPRSQISAAEIESRALMDLLVISYRDPDGGAASARFVFLKDRSPLARQFVGSLATMPLAGAAA